MKRKIIKKAIRDLINELDYDLAKELDDPEGYGAERDWDDLVDLFEASIEHSKQIRRDEKRARDFRRLLDGEEIATPEHEYDGHEAEHERA